MLGEYNLIRGLTLTRHTQNSSPAVCWYGTLLTLVAVPNVTQSADCMVGSPTRCMESHNYTTTLGRPTVGDNLPRLFVQPSVWTDEFDCFPRDPLICIHRPVCNVRVASLKVGSNSHEVVIQALAQPHIPCMIQRVADNAIAPCV